MNVSNAMRKWGFTQLLLFRVAVGLWVVALVVVCVRAYCNPTQNTVTLGYSLASEAWWGRGKMYIGPGGMNYLPHFAIIFSAFDALPGPLGEVLWRVLAFALLGTGLWRLCRRLFPDSHCVIFGSDARLSGASHGDPLGGNASRCDASHCDPYSAFFWTTVLTLPLSLAALRNGQANAVFAGILLHAMASLASKKWWQAAGWMALSVAVKPLGIVLVLLAPFVYRRLWWRLPVAVGGLVAAPFLFGAPGFVAGQYHAFATNLQMCSVVNDNSYADIGGVLRAMHVEMPPGVSKGVRVLAGLPVLALWVWGAWRLGGRGALRELWLLALAGAYLMLFNPMNEANSYVIMAPGFALWGVWLLRDGKRKRKWTGWGIVAIIYTMSVGPALLHPWFGTRFALVWHPVMTGVFIALLIQVIRISRRDAEARRDEG